jgi:predicted GNAT family N-acyltransferase
MRVIQPVTEKDFEAYYQLRYDTLRKPWNQPLGTEKDDKENESIHLFALDGEIPAGVCRIQFNNEKEAQVRFMGVDEKFRGKGVGKVLMEEAEKITKENKRSLIVLQARENAVPFYKSCGYTIREKTFLMWNEIQHYLMEKTI